MNQAKIEIFLKDDKLSVMSPMDKILALGMLEVAKFNIMTSDPQPQPGQISVPPGTLEAV